MTDAAKLTAIRNLIKRNPNWHGPLDAAYCDVNGADILAILDDAFIDVVFDGPPGPESGRFVECEAPDGTSIDVGEWIDRGNGVWALRIRCFHDEQVTA